MWNATSFIPFIIALVILDPAGAKPLEDETADPTKAEVLLPTESDNWQASLLIDNDVGIWTVGETQAFAQYGCPEVFGLDDKGRCIILVSYSGKWTPFQTVHDGEWLGALQNFDLDPHLPGREIYTGGKKGNLFQIRPHRQGTFDTRVIARFPGDEIHTLVGGDLLPGRAGNELLAFSRDGDVWDIRPPKAPGGDFESPKIASLGGRVRQALILPGKPGASPWIAAACRFGQIVLLRMGDDGITSKAIVEEPMGFGRIAMRRTAPGEAVVLYCTRDDGVILRLQGYPDGGEWDREIIYAGPQGPRGVASGRFNADPTVETVAVFGYSKEIQLLSRRPGEAWQVETLFVERDKGHWIEAVEIDGRNATDELIASGYAGRIIALSRPPGYGLDDVPTLPRQLKSARRDTDPVRVAVRARAPVMGNLHPLSYRGGFETKTTLYETLLKRDAKGRLAPGLAQDWRVENGGKTVVLTLRDGATWHDGTPVDAAAVSTHIRRWAGMPEHAWLRSSDRIRSVTAPNTREVHIELDPPCALLPDLCAVNPTAVRAPAALTREGEFTAPIGSGPYRLRDAVRDDLLRVDPIAADAETVDLLLVASANDAIARLRSGDVDVVADGEQRLVPRDQLSALRDDPRFVVRSGPGSSVTYVSFRMQGPTAAREVRAAVRDAIDREELIARSELGAADPCHSWAANTVEVWPRSSYNDGERVASVDVSRPLRVLGGKHDALATEIVEQLNRAGLPAELTSDTTHADPSTDEWDLRTESTWGVPYDPYMSLLARFLPPPAAPTAATERFIEVDAELSNLISAAALEPDPERMEDHYRCIQQRMDEAVAIIPLFVPRRVSVVRRGISGPDLDHDLYRVDLASIHRSSVSAPLLSDRSRGGD